MLTRSVECRGDDDGDMMGFDVPPQSLLATYDARCRLLAISVSSRIDRSRESVAKSSSLCSIQRRDPQRYSKDSVQMPNKGCCKLIALEGNVGDEHAAL